ncbi:MAG: DUF4268 domain-containing protein [Chitinophagaceae bacterium]
MYSKQETALLKKNFWTSFGQYMRPLPGAGGEPVNWLNYKTGIRHLYFRLDADSRQAAIGIELRHPDPDLRRQYYEQLEQLKAILEQETGEAWEWQLHAIDEDGREVSRIGIQLPGVNIFRREDWPAIISFFKPRLLALDAFWELVREGFE